MLLTCRTPVRRGSDAELYHSPTQQAAGIRQTFEWPTLLAIRHLGFRFAASPL